MVSWGSASSLVYLRYMELLSQRISRKQDWVAFGSCGCLEYNKLSVPNVGSFWCCPSYSQRCQSQDWHFSKLSRPPTSSELLQTSTVSHGQHLFNTLFIMSFHTIPHTKRALNWTFPAQHLHSCSLFIRLLLWASSSLCRVILSETRWNQQRNKRTDPVSCKDSHD